jgi:type IV pilus assembly protein PilB
VLKRVPEKLVRARTVLPVRVISCARGVLVVATAEPADLCVLDEVAFAAGMNVQPVLASRRSIERAIDRHFPRTPIGGLPRVLCVPTLPGPALAAAS